MEIGAFIVCGFTLFLVGHLVDTGREYRRQLYEIKTRLWNLEESLDNHDRLEFDRFEDLIKEFKSLGKEEAER